jgi:hypothetical protein
MNGNKNAGQLFGEWLADYLSKLPVQQGLLRVRAAVPRPQTRNYFLRYKVEIATFDGTGQNPTNATCIVVEVSETDQTALIAAGTTCGSVPDV